MLGIPQAGTPEATSFYISFWAGLYSGIIYSIFTGLFVGLSIWIVQRRSEKRQFIKECEREIAIFKEHLRSLLKKPDYINITNIIESAPIPALEIMNLMEKHPIDLWYENVSKQEYFLNLIKRVQKNLISFNEIAIKLDFNISKFIRTHNASMDRNAEFDPYAYSFFIGHIHDMSDQDILAKIDMSENTLPWLKATCDAAKQYDSVNELIQPYLRARLELGEKLSNLREYLG